MMTKHGMVLVRCSSSMMVTQGRALVRCHSCMMVTQDSLGKSKTTMEITPGKAKKRRLCSMKVMGGRAMRMSSSSKDTIQGRGVGPKAQVGATRGM